MDKKRGVIKIFLCKQNQNLRKMTDHYMKCFFTWENPDSKPIDANILIYLGDIVSKDNDVDCNIMYIEKGKAFFTQSKRALLRELNQEDISKWSADILVVLGVYHEYVNQTITIGPAVVKAPFITEPKHEKILFVKSLGSNIHCLVTPFTKSPFINCQITYFDKGVQSTAFADLRCLQNVSLGKK